MALPQTVRVKLSSEAAESISLTPVVVQELAIRELIEHMLGVTGKDEARIRDLLMRGTLVSGASRFRWAGVASEVEAIREVLATFPDADPSRAFTRERCVRATLRGGRQAIEVPRDAAERKGFFQKATFWELLMDVVASGDVVYQGYSYREKADRYLRELTVADAARLREGSGLVRYSTLSEQIRAVGYLQVEVYVSR